MHTQALADIVLRDPHIGTSPTTQRAPSDMPADDQIPSPSQFFELWYQRGVNHPTRNSELRKAYSANAITPFEGAFETLAVSLLADLPRSGDLVKSFITPYSLRSTFTLMGFDHAIWSNLTKAYHVLIFVMRRRFQGASELSDRHLAAFATALTCLRDAIQDALNTTHPTPLITALRNNVATGGATIWPDVATIGQLLGAGVPQLNTGIAVTARALFGDPTLQQRVHDGEFDPAQIAEEAMRLHPPFTNIFGWVTDPCDCLGIRLDPGATVVIDIPTVNCDPTRVPQPTNFRPGRNHITNYTFGKGTHYCVGASSARHQIAAAIRALLAHDHPLIIDPNQIHITNDAFAHSVTVMPFHTESGPGVPQMIRV